MRKLFYQCGEKKRKYITTILCTVFEHYILFWALVRWSATVWSATAYRAIGRPEYCLGCSPSLYGWIRSTSRKLFLRLRLFLVLLRIKNCVLWWWACIAHSLCIVCCVHDDLEYFLLTRLSLVMTLLNKRVGAELNFNALHLIRKRTGKVMLG